jgi:hypothetical protein
MGENAVNGDRAQSQFLEVTSSASAFLCDLYLLYVLVV